MNQQKKTGAIIGLITGFCCWFLLGFMGLPQVLITISGIWVIEPVLRLLGLHGQTNLLLPALAVCLAAFTFYGWLLGSVVAAFSNGAKQE